MTASLPDEYAWLARETGPRVLVEALKLYGTLERVGPASNPVILAWAKEVGVEKDYTDDGTAWCGLFMAVIAKRANWPLVDAPLWARAWAGWQGKSPRPSLGDVLVFARKGGGHVGLYVGEDETFYHVLGGNQGDAVSVMRIAKSRCIAIRRPIWRQSQPARVRPIHLAATGEISMNEA